MRIAFQERSPGAAQSEEWEAFSYYRCRVEEGQLRTRGSRTWGGGRRKEPDLAEVQPDSAGGGGELSLPRERTRPPSSRHESEEES